MTSWNPMVGSQLWSSQAEDGQPFGRSSILDQYPPGFVEDVTTQNRLGSFLFWSALLLLVGIHSSTVASAQSSSGKTSAYQRGVAAIQRADLPSAQKHFEDAIKL